MLNVLLDLDGTISDPRTGFVASISHALQGLGRAIPPEEAIASHIGPPLEETLGKLIGGNDKSEIAEAVSLYRQHYSDVGILQNVIYPGIPEALDQLRTSGAAIYLATSKPQVFAQRILDRSDLAKCFKAIYGSELDGARANKAELLSHLLGQEGLSTERTVMVGDRWHDIAAASRNGLASCGVLWGYGSREELTGAGAMLLLDAPIQLGDLASNRALRLMPTSWPSRLE